METLDLISSEPHLFPFSRLTFFAYFILLQWISTQNNGLMVTICAMQTTLIIPYRKPYFQLGFHYSALRPAVQNRPVGPSDIKLIGDEKKAHSVRFSGCNFQLAVYLVCLWAVNLNKGWTQ